MAYIYKIPESEGMMSAAYFEHDRQLTAEEFAAMVKVAHEAAGGKHLLTWIAKGEPVFLQSMFDQGFRPPAAEAVFIKKSDRK